MSLVDLEAAEDLIKTRMGRSFLGERVVYRGKDLHHELSDKSWIELFAFGITGKHYLDAEIALLNYMWLATSYPDKSIWPNHITALAGSARTTPALALSAGMAASEASIFGARPLRTGLDFFQRANAYIQQGGDVKDFVMEELKLHSPIYGYGRPLASTDERVPHLIRFVKQQNLPCLTHFNIALDVAKILSKEKNISMNVAAPYAALGADLGFSAKQFHLFMTLCFIAGMPPCFIEANEQKAGTFLPVRCERLRYTGPDKRAW